MDAEEKEKTRTASPISEVGSAYSQGFSSDQWRALLESQSKNFMELIKSMQTSKMKTQTSVTLPKFNPDTANAAATVDIDRAENMLEGSALVMTLSNSLEGGAS